MKARAAMLTAVLVASPMPAQAHKKAKRYQPHHGIHTYADLDHCESTHGQGSKNHFQFTLATWRKAGGRGSPANASYSEQLERADAWQKKAGWGQWPSCARAIGMLH